MFSIKSILVFNDNHLLNFSRENTVIYSAMISSDTSNTPIVRAFF